MIKFLLILFLIFFIASRVIGIVVKILFPQSQTYKRSFHKNQYEKPTKKTGEINVDYVPKKSRKSKKSFSKGGEYIDYEEVE